MHDGILVSLGSLCCFPHRTYGDAKASCIIAGHRRVCLNKLPGDLYCRYKRNETCILKELCSFLPQKKGLQLPGVTLYHLWGFHRKDKRENKIHLTDLQRRQWQRQRAQQPRKSDSPRASIICNYLFPAYKHRPESSFIYCHLLMSKL